MVSPPLSCARWRGKIPDAVADQVDGQHQQHQGDPGMAITQGEKNM